jgi:hypothetical protein
MLEIFSGLSPIALSGLSLKDLTFLSLPFLQKISNFNLIRLPSPRGYYLCKLSPTFLLARVFIILEGSLSTAEKFFLFHTTTPLAYNKMVIRY